MKTHNIKTEENRMSLDKSNNKALSMVIIYYTFVVHVLYRRYYGNCWEARNEMKVAATDISWFLVDVYNWETAQIITKKKFKG
jgi:hypothetical protein